VARLNWDFGSMDPHIWATDSGLLDLAGARGKGLFSGVGGGCTWQSFGGDLRNDPILAILRSIATFGTSYSRVPIFGGGMGPMWNLQNPKRSYFKSKSLMTQYGWCNEGLFFF
jgi:hypothetical protein